MVGYSDFFKTATGFLPYRYQVKIGEEGYPEVLKAETGSGKTAAITIPWLWKHATNKEETTRLLVVEPMRTLTEQVSKEIIKWVKNSGLEIPVHVIMGGEVTEDWRLKPNIPQILVGTVDMLLSRGLGFGYGIPRRQTNVDFGLLNYDTRWVYDEVQLLGPANETSAWLHFNRSEEFKCYTTWTSATISKEQYAKWLKREPTYLESDVKNEDERLKKKAEAEKLISKTSFEESIEEAINFQGFGLFVCNTVKKSLEAYEFIKKHKSNVVLINSRFRPLDRAKAIDEMFKIATSGNGIVVSTQVIEAGIDLDSDIMWTQLCPWSSFVQRTGRVNRNGVKKGIVKYFDDDLISPYSKEEIDETEKKLELLPSPATPANMTFNTEPESRTHWSQLDKYFISDASGSTSNLSQYIRSKNRNVNVLWREVDNQKTKTYPHRNELLSIDIRSLKNYIEGTDNNILEWNETEEEFLAFNSFKPNSLYLLSSEDGGYTPEKGWLGIDSSRYVNPAEKKEIKAIPRFWSSGSWYKLETHLQDTETIAKKYFPNNKILQESALWHDIGKAHSVFQNGLRLEREDFPSYPIAKSPKKGSSKKHPYGKRQNFRHELASAYILLEINPSVKPEILYNIINHHGRFPPDLDQKEVRRMFSDSLQEGDKIMKTDFSPELTVEKRNMNELFEFLFDLPNISNRNFLALSLGVAGVRISDWEASGLT